MYKRRPHRAHSPRSLLLDTSRCISRTVLLTVSYTRIHIHVYRRLLLLTCRRRDQAPAHTDQEARGNNLVDLIPGEAIKLVTNKLIQRMVSIAGTRMKTTRLEQATHWSRGLAQKIYPASNALDNTEDCFKQSFGNQFRLTNDFLARHRRGTDLVAHGEQSRRKR